MKALSSNMVFCTLDVDDMGQRIHFETEGYFDNQRRTCVKFEIPNGADNDASETLLLTDLGFWVLTRLLNRHEIAVDEAATFETTNYVPVVYSDERQGRPYVVMDEEFYRVKDGRAYCGSFELPHLSTDILMFHKTLLRDLGKKIHGLIEYRQ